jgi:antitoxin component of MazEF toxin-antitoxin module
MEEDVMKNRIAVSLMAMSLLASGSALAQSTTATGAVNGARTGGAVAGPVGEIVGGTVGAAVGAAVEIPTAVITSVQAEHTDSVTVEQRVVVGEPLPAAVEVRPVPGYGDYRYAVVNNQRLIVDPRTRRVIRVIQ